MSSVLFIALAAFAIGCEDHGDTQPDLSKTDSGDEHTDPLDGRQPVPLSPLRSLRSTPLLEAIAPQSLVLDPTHGQALILDREAETVWATDALYLHDPRPVCIDHTDVRASTPGENGQPCPAGTERIARGHIQTPSPPAAIAAIPTGGMVAILDQGGQIHWIKTDATQSPSFDFMRPTEGPVLGVIIPNSAVVHLTITEHEIGVAIDHVLHIFDLSGAPKNQLEHQEIIQSIDHHDGAWWTTTAQNTRQDGREAGPGGMALVPSQVGLWVLTPTALVPLHSEAMPIEVTQPTGKAIFWGDRVLYTTVDGVMEPLPDGDVLTFEDSILDLQTNAAHELVVLDANHTVRVYVDETIYSPTHPLHVWGATFIEKPRKSDIQIACKGPTNSIQAIHARAHINLNWLNDTPADFSLGVTPAHWQRATQCERTERLHAFVSDLELGILFHEAPLQCDGNQSCYQAVLQADLDSFTDPPHWVSGLGSHTDLAVDWVHALREIGAPSQYAFFGMSLRPDVTHSDDIRSKNNWPSALGNHSQMWMVDSVSQLLEGNPGGWLHVFPGNNIPMFNLGGCANLFLNECHALGRGGGGAVGEADIESLNILLHRALMSGQRDGTHTWSFHLPDIGEYDYTDGCTEAEGRWYGADCEAARIQAWLFDVHLRLVDKGLMHWALPSQLGQP